MHESVFASAKRWQGPDRSTSYYYLYPLRRQGTFASVTPKDLEHPFSFPFSSASAPPHAHTSSCLSPGRRQHLIAGTILAFVIYHTRIAHMKNVSASSVYVSRLDDATFLSPCSKLPPTYHDCIEVRTPTQSKHLRDVYD